MSQPQPSADTIRALLKSREENQDSPGEDVLVPVYGFLSDATAYTANSGPSLGSPMERHWFCKLAPSEVHTEAATYLLFLFAFDLVGTAKEWIVQLDHVLRGCAHCARGFCGARRTLGAKFVFLNAAVQPGLTLSTGISAGTQPRLKLSSSMRLTPGFHRSYFSPRLPRPSRVIRLLALLSYRYLRPCSNYFSASHHSFRGQRSLNSLS